MAMPFQLAASNSVTPRGTRTWRPLGSNRRVTLALTAPSLTAPSPSALPSPAERSVTVAPPVLINAVPAWPDEPRSRPLPMDRSEEHTSELQSPYDLVCRLLLEKKKKNKKNN